MITRIVSIILLFALGFYAAAYDPGRFEREVLVPGSRDVFWFSVKCSGSKTRV